LLGDSIECLHDVLAVLAFSFRFDVDRNKPNQRSWIQILRLATKLPLLSGEAA
jgi:hypothetical protein